jgi:hypothetical protein
MVFFESRQRLVATDANDVQDVYEWEAFGVGGCQDEQGCISLISSGRGSQASFLYSVAANGRDVYFTTTDRLVPGAVGGAPALYDARINGGFPVPPPSSGCELESCQDAGTTGLSHPITPASAGVVGNGNVRPGKKICRKTQRRIVRHGKVRCVKKRRSAHGHSGSRGKKQGGSK